MRGEIMEANEKKWKIVRHTESPQIGDLGKKSKTRLNENKEKTTHFKTEVTK
jgi:hypothetical protein